MRLKCAGCGVREKVRFATWWFYFMQNEKEPYLWHWQCLQDLRDQRKLDGIDDT